MEKCSVDWFLVGMVCALFLAWLMPEPGASGGILHPEILTNCGIAVVFFLHGLGLTFASLRTGLLQWRLHLLVQSCVFLVFPAFGFTLFFFLENFLPFELRIGLLYLCALPSTVSSSVALTATAQGNVPAAVFNATISSLIGVVMTPMIMKLVLDGGDSLGSMTSVIFKLCLLLVLPLVCGQLLRPFLGGWATRNKPFISTVDRTTILILVYTSFCDSFVLGVWTKYPVSSLATTVLISAGLFVLIFIFTSWLGRLMHLNREDRITAIFCGSKKSLASGVPMSQVMFAGNPSLGLILMPVILYHQLQLVVCGVLASKWGKEADLLSNAQHAQTTDPQIPRSLPEGVPESPVSAP